LDKASLHTQSRDISTDLGIDTTPHFDPLGDSGDVTHLDLVANL